MKMECKKYEDSKIRSWRAEDGAEQMIKEDIGHWRISMHPAPVGVMRSTYITVPKGEAGNSIIEKAAALLDAASCADDALEDAIEREVMESGLDCRIVRCRGLC